MKNTDSSDTARSLAFMLAQRQGQKLPDPRMVHLFEVIEHGMAVWKGQQKRHEADITALKAKLHKLETKTEVD